MLTGSLLAQQMISAWLRLKGYPNFCPELEKGICQYLAHRWLETWSILILIHLEN
ncbi:putative protein DA1 [Rosa chinensis]|uniref:Protein DA1-like domain-containing protein n=2 Tax=Rosa chinensis TaxID=74649 RepID=A0A2P6RQ54_ROSCH|nr:putative protein DA1 [Rosa chinensis]